MLTRAFVAMCFIAVCASFSSMVYLYYPAHLIRLGMDARDIGTVMSGFFWGAILGLPLADWIMRVAGGRLLIAIGLLSLAVASLELSVTNSFWPIFAARALHGVGWSAVNVAGAILVTAAAPEGRLGQVLTLLGLSFVVGQGVAPYAGALIGGDSFDAVFYVAAAVALVAGLGLPLLPAASVKAAPRPAAATAASGRKTWRRLIVPLLAMALFVIPALGTMTLVTAFAAGAGFVDAGPWYFIGFMSATVLTRLGGGRLLDLFNRSLLAVGAGLVACCGQLVLSALTAPWHLAAAGILAGAAASIYIPSLQALVIERSRDRIGAVTSFRMVIELSGALGSAAGGVVAKAAGYTTMFGLGAALSLAGALLILREATSGPYRIDAADRPA